MRRLMIPTLILLLAPFEVFSQTAPQTPPEFLDPAVEWLTRLNALDDWYLSVDGEEQGIDAVVDSMMELYAPEILLEVPPHDEDQIGPVMLRGLEQVRKWVDKFARTQVSLEYIHKRQTEGSAEGEPLVYTTPLPWGGVGIAYPIHAIYSMREDRRRFTGPGAVFLQYGEDGKIKRLRLFVTEIAQVEPQ
jgi:hypothetical protein